ncbi:enoyl-CoA hydratase/isomerase family protein [Gordonia hydrophobica]|uniref:Enoyl-CoA hydratase-related protein n=1 Tax=Gordonia hydrophobica TaxID=40516 RepID=A0ABZ2U511_9ACTN|nr:enoyl-CoA hydratase-related protein [Gordonia hydrophobica]MBM7368645.1 2-(1,2-epoxy-1,2-dihydrophenyl)acetyl-CoA isomerase [Gordonia hydrophobica]
MPEVILDRCGAVATVTLNRPDAMNAMNTPLLDQLVGTLETLSDDPTTRVIILTGAGRAFCAGGDLHADYSGGSNAQAESRLRHHVRAAEILREGDAVSIAAINGPAAGAGFSLAAACDLRYMADTAVLRSAFLTAAMSGDFGLGWSLSRLLGTARATEILLLNEKITADRALQIGLVTGVTSHAELDETVRAAAQKLAAGPPLAIAGIKQNLHDATTLPFTECLRRETSTHVAVARSADVAEAGAAFLAKRAPHFIGS